MQAKQSLCHPHVTHLCATLGMQVRDLSTALTAAREQHARELQQRDEAAQAIQHELQRQLAALSDERNHALARVANAKNDLGMLQDRLSGVQVRVLHS